MFGGNLGEWDTEPINLDINSYSKPFNCKHYPVSRINKHTFHKELQFLVEIGVLNPAQQYKYGTPIFIISKK